MSLTALSFSSPTSLQHTELLEVLPPKTSRERFIYYTVIDPRLPPVVRKTMEVALIVIAALMYAVTLGMGALFVHNAIQTYYQYTLAQKQLETTYAESEQTLLSSIRSYNETGNINSVQEASEKIFLLAEAGFLERALYLAGHVPDLKTKTEESPILALDTSNTQSELVLQIAGHLEKKGEIEKAKIALKTIHNPIERAKQLLFLCCRQRLFQEAQTYVNSALDRDVKCYLKAQLCLVEGKYEEAFTNIRSIAQTNMKIQALFEMENIFKTSLLNSPFVSLKLRLLEEIDKSIAEIDKASDGLALRTAEQRALLANDISKQAIFSQISMHLVKKDYNEALDTLKRLEVALDVKEALLREILDLPLTTESLDKNSLDFLREFSEMTGNQTLKEDIAQLLHDAQPSETLK